MRETIVRRKAWAIRRLRLAADKRLLAELPGGPRGWLCFASEGGITAAGILFCDPPNIGQELWIDGNIDSVAMKHFETSGWKVREDAQTVLLKILAEFIETIENIRNLLQPA